MAVRPIAVFVLAALAAAAAPAWALHKESPPAYRITRGGSHFHPATRSWGNWFAFISSEDLARNGNTSEQIFVFNLAFFDCFQGTTFPTTPCPDPPVPYLVQATSSPEGPDNPSIGVPFAVNGTLNRIGSGNPANNYDCVPNSPDVPCTVAHWLAFDAPGSFLGGTGPWAAFRQIFVKNLVNGEIRQLTFGVDGDSTRPNVNELGGLIAFQSTARLLPTSPTPPGVSQIYVYRVGQRVLRQLTYGLGPSTNPMPNGGGGVIAFESTADLLGGGADTGISQIFWAEYDKGSNTATLHQLTRGNGPSRNPYVSDVQTFIAFESEATDLPGTLGAVGTSVYLSTPIGSPTLQPPQLQQITVPSVFGDCGWPAISALSEAQNIAFICTGDPLLNGTVGNRVFVFHRDEFALWQITGAGDVQPPIGTNMGTWFLTLATTSPLTGESGCGYQLYFVDYLGTRQSGHEPKWMPAAQIGELPPDVALAASGPSTNLIGAHNLSIRPGGGATGSEATVTTRDGTTIIPIEGPDQAPDVIRLVVGAPSEFTGQASIRVPGNRLRLPAVPVDGLGTFCFAARGDGAGVIDCDGGDAGGDLLVFQDHDVDDANPRCIGGCREGAPCAGDLVGPHQNPCPVCVRSQPEGVEGVCSSGPNVGQACLGDANCAGNDECIDGKLGVCNGPVVGQWRGAFEPGGMRLTLPLTLAVSTDWGVDGKACTADDRYAVQNQPVTLRLTTGAADAVVTDADHIFGASIVTAASGVPFTCPGLQAGAMADARLVGGLPLLDVPQIPELRDMILGFRFAPRPEDSSCLNECASGGDCDDGNACNGAETCVAGTCEPGVPVVCTGGDPCTGFEVCDPSSGACVPGPPCDDGDPCNGVETCDLVNGCQPGTPIVCDDNDACNGVETCNPVDGTCLPGAPPACDDDNVCTADSCDPAVGCVYDPVPGPCDDGSLCTTGDTCVAGICVGAAVPCDDGDACNGFENCDPATGLCLPGTPPDCDDGNPCLAASCDPGVGCVYTEVLGPCDDDDACTTGDTCIAGVCTGAPVLCDDGDMCTGAETCDPESGCQAGVPPPCDDGNPCTDGLCDSLLGCLFVNNTNPCDDGSACTTGDTCALGTCTGVPVVCDDGDMCNGVETCNPADGTCQPGTPLACDDGNPCTDDLCDPLLGCVFTNNANPCDDGNACTTGDICTAGACVGVPVVCDDGDVCNGAEICNPGSGTCEPGMPPPPCDDGDACTPDFCDPVFGCLSGPPDPLCLSGLVVIELRKLVDELRDTPPSLVGGPRRHAHLLARLVKVERLLERALREPRRARRLYARALKLLIRIQRGVRRGVLRDKFDLEFAHHLMVETTTLMDELRPRLKRGP